MGIYDQAIQQLYVAYFNRPADPAGLNYWNTVVTANKGSTTAVSAAFAGSAEYKAAYAGLNSTQIVDRVYQNLFGRAAEPSGLAYWALNLDQKNMTIDNVVTTISAAAQGTDATAYKNKVTAATSFTTALDTNAEIVGYTGDAALGIAKTYISSVTDDASLAKAIATDALNQTVFAATAGALTVGTLTNGVDNLVAHTFNAPQVYTPGGNNFINSLQNDDKLTGTDASDDVLNVTLGNPNDNGQAEILPTLSKIETINAKFDATSQSMVLDLQDSTGVKAINITRIADGKNATVKNITDAATNNLSVANTQSPAGTVTFNYLTSAVAGATDTVNVTASNINVANLTVQSADGTKGFETFNLTSTGSANTIKQLTAQDVQTLKITGDTNLTLGAASNTVNISNSQQEATRYAAGLDNVGGSLKAVDASALKGALDITIGTEMNAGVDGTSGLNINETITGGSGNDIFRLATGTNVDAADSIIGGAAAGTDTNTLVLLGNNTVAGTVSKVQALEIRTGHDAINQANNTFAGNTDTVNVDASKITDLATTYIRNEGQVSNVVNNVTVWNSASEGAVVNLTKLTAAQDTAITIAHGTTGNSALANLAVSLSLATATGTTDKAAVTIVDGVNTDPVFNFSLVTPATEQLTITDNDTESNSVYLSGVSSYAGAASSITLVNGAAGKYLNLDTYAGAAVVAPVVGVATLANVATNKGYGFATDGLASDNAALLAKADTDNSLTVAAGTARRDAAVATVFNPTAAVVGDRIIAENLDGSKYVGDIIARFGDITRADGVSSQSIVGGTGNDTFIFDGITNENGGYTAADTVKGGAGTDTLIIDGDTSLLAGTPRITTNTSEWDNTTGIDVLRFAKNEGVANVGNSSVGSAVVAAGATNISVNGVRVTGGGYYAHIDNDFISQTDAGNRLTVINNDGDRATSSESDLVLDLTGLSQLKFVTYVGANGNGQANHASTRVIVDDISSNQNMILNGGDISGVTGLSGNNNVYNVLNTANVSIADLSQTSNFATLEFTNNQAVAQTLNLTLNNTIVEQLVDASSTATTAALQEVLTIYATDNGVGAGAVASALNVDARSVTGFHGLNIAGSVAGNDIIRLDANVGGTADAINLGASAGDRINWTGTATTVAIDTAAGTSAFTVGTTTTQHTTVGVEYVDISGLTYTSSTLAGAAAVADTLVGGAGNDMIAGSGATIVAGAYTVVAASTGADVLTGGAGNDQFALGLTNALANISTITDLNLGTAVVGGQVDRVVFDLATPGAVTAVTVADLTANQAAISATATFALAADAVLTLLNGVANRAATFTYGTDTYLAINGVAGGNAFAAGEDVIVKITGVTGTLDASDIIVL